jgi:hypothetical protein
MIWLGSPRQNLRPLYSLHSDIYLEYFYNILGAEPARLNMKFFANLPRTDFDSSFQNDIILGLLLGKPRPMGLLKRVLRVSWFRVSRWTDRDSDFLEESRKTKTLFSESKRMYMVGCNDFSLGTGRCNACLGPSVFGSPYNYWVATSACSPTKQGWHSWRYRTQGWANVSCSWSTWSSMWPCYAPPAMPPSMFSLA